MSNGKLSHVRLRMYVYEVTHYLSLVKSTFITLREEKTTRLDTMDTAKGHTKEEATQSREE